MGGSDEAEAEEEAAKVLSGDVDEEEGGLRFEGGEPGGVRRMCLLLPEVPTSCCLRLKARKGTLSCSE